MTKKLSTMLPAAIAIVAGLLTLIPPFVIGTGTSALTLQSLEHWMHSAPDSFEALHVHWVWVARVIALVTGDAFSALVIFRAVVVGLSVYFFLLTARRLFDERRAMIGAAMLVLNVTILYLSHTFGTELLTLLAATVLLYLFSSPNPRNHKLAAILFGLSLSIGFWPFVLLLAVITIGLSFHHALYTPRERRTYILFGLMLLGMASYLLLEVLYFGASSMWAAMTPKFFPPRSISLILQGIIIAVFSGNLLFVSIFRKKPGGIGRDFQSAFIILGIFFITNTFSRQEMLQDVMIFVPCMILIALDKWRHIGRMASVYIVCNLGLFFLLPSIQTDSQIAMADSKRTHTNDEISFSYYESSDIVSYAHLRTEQSGEAEARELLSTERLDSTLVLINPSTDTWFDAATLGAEFPHNNFGWYYGQPTNLVRMNGLLDTSFIRPTPAMPYLAGLFEKTFARTFLDSALAPGTVLHESEHFQYIDCHINDFAGKTLIDQLIRAQYQGYHHH